MSSARSVCREVIKSTVPPELWEQNSRFAEEIHTLISTHPLATHPLISQLDMSQLSVPALVRAHLEFRYTFAQIFTDSLLRAMVLAETLEPRLGVLGKASARFLLQFNVLDELGFSASNEAGGDYGGSPRKAHYVQFDETLKQLGMTQEQIVSYQPSEAAVTLRRAIEANYADYSMLLASLAVAESIFDKFAGPWAKSMATRTSVNTEDGYHSIHVEHEGESLDAYHSEDLWYVFRQGVEPSRYEDIRTRTAAYLDTLKRFVDNLAAA